MTCREITLLCYYKFGLFILNYKHTQLSRTFMHIFGKSPRRCVNQLRTHSSRKAQVVCHPRAQGVLVCINYFVNSYSSFDSPRIKSNKTWLSLVMIELFLDFHTISSRVKEIARRPLGSAENWTASARHWSLAWVSKGYVKCDSWIC